MASLLSLSYGQIDTWFRECRFKAVLLNETHMRFVAQVPYNLYFSVGFGPDMDGYDMVVWQAHPNYVVCRDTYSDDDDPPPNDRRPNDYYSVINKNDTHVEFISDRALRTGDPQDFDFALVSLK